MRDFLAKVKRFLRGERLRPASPPRRPMDCIKCGDPRAIYYERGVGFLCHYCYPPYLRRQNFGHSEREQGRKLAGDPR